MNNRFWRAVLFFFRRIERWISAVVIWQKCCVSRYHYKRLFFFLFEGEMSEGERLSLAFMFFCCCWVREKKWKMRFFQFQTVTIWLLTCPTENSWRHEPSHKSVHISILHKRKTSISDSSNNEINTETFPEKSCRFFYAFTASIWCKKIFWLFNKSTLDPQSLNFHDFLYHRLESPLKTWSCICSPYCFHLY